VRAVEIDERANARGMELREPRELAAAERPAGHVDGRETQAVEELPQVLRQRVGIVGRPDFGAAVAPPRVGDHTPPVPEGGREVVEVVRGITEPVDEHQRLARPTPVEIVEPHPVDGDEVARVG
jgi:hypothetical protein